MKKIYATRRGLISLDDNNVPRFEEESREGIERIYLVEEPSHIVYDRENKHIELDAQKGDILVTFYGSVFETPIILINSKEWANNIIKYNEAEQKRKEEWAMKHSEPKTED